MRRHAWTRPSPKALPAPLREPALAAQLHRLALAALLLAIVSAAAPTGSAAASLAGYTTAPASDETRPKLAVLDIELTGDLGGPQFAPEHAARLRMASELLRRQLTDSGLYQVLDLSPARPLIAKLASGQMYLHDCNGCDLEIGRALGANQTMVAWVDRVSGLILTLTFEIHDVAAGQIRMRKSYDFRGDNDAAWRHAITYMVRDIRETRTGTP